MQNPTGPNEDFQTAEVRKYAEAIYGMTEDKLIKAIVDTLGIADEKDVNGDPMVYEFSYLYSMLLEKGYNINHSFVEKGGKTTLKVSIFKLEKEYEYDIKSTFKVTAN